MYVTLKNIRTISGPLAPSFELSSDIIRIIEFEDVAVVWLDENRNRNKVVGIKFSQEKGINHYYVAWEFQVTDNFGKPRYIDAVERRSYQGKDWDNII